MKNYRKDGPKLITIMQNGRTRKNGQQLEDSDQTLGERFLPEGCSSFRAGFFLSKAMWILSSETLKPNWTKPWAAGAEFRVHLVLSKWVTAWGRGPLAFGLVAIVLCLPGCTKYFSVETCNVNRWELEICFSSKRIFSYLIALEYYSFNRVFSMPLYQSLYQSSQSHSHIIPSTASLIVNTESSMIFPLLHSTHNLARFFILLSCKSLALKPELSAMLPYLSLYQDAH